MLGTAAMMVWCGLTMVGVGVSDIEKRCNAHRMSGNAFCIFSVRRYTCIFGCTDVVLCKSYQLVVYVTINYIKRIMLERENIYELTDIILILYIC